jgi:hypothetical protein
MLNTSPEPVSNWTASVTEDLVVVGGIWAALNHPVAFLIALAVIIGITIWILPKLWRAIKHFGNSIRSFLSGNAQETVDQPSDIKPLFKP